MGTDIVEELPYTEARSFDQGAEFADELGFQAGRVARREEDPQFEHCATLFEPAQVKSGLGDNLFKSDGQGLCRPPAQQSRTTEKLLSGKGCGLSLYPLGETGLMVLH